MTGKQRGRMALDVTMTALSVVLMGGTLLFADDRVHQLLGMVLLALWICHTALNRRWYGAMLRGAYPPYRIMQLAVNLGIAVCALLLMASGMMLAWFMPVSVGMNAARTAHLLASHWYYLFMCAHIGMHVGVMCNRMQKPRHATAPERRWKRLVLRCALALVCVYGAYAFAVRGIAGYLFLRRQFFFLDLAHGYLLFFADYVAMLVLFAALSHYAGRCLLALTKRKHKDAA